VTARLNRSLRGLAADFRTILAAAQEKRADRPDLVTVDGESMCAWAFYERQVMHEAVSRVRAETGLTPLPIEAVTRAENLAAGHSDYSQKYAFYCAELAQGYGDFPNQ
jgi:hypothetical protein